MALVSIVTTLWEKSAPKLKTKIVIALVKLAVLPAPSNQPNVLAPAGCTLRDRSPARSTCAIAGTNKDG